MVDVADKEVTRRTAIGHRGPAHHRGGRRAAARRRPCRRATRSARPGSPGIMGAKRTPDLIPLCHPIAARRRDRRPRRRRRPVAITATVRTADRTGVEMEALTAVAVAGLTLHDMIKARRPGGDAGRSARRAQGGRQVRHLDQTGGPLRAHSGPDAPRARRHRVQPRRGRRLHRPRRADHRRRGSASWASPRRDPVVVPDGEPVAAALRDAVADGARRRRHHRRHRHLPDRRDARGDPRGPRLRDPGARRRDPARRRRRGADLGAVTWPGRGRRPHPGGQPARLHRAGCATG